MAEVFQGVELYRSTENLLYKNRTWCVENADLRYSGTNQSFSDTGLSGNTQYYYKIFAKYLDVDVTSYSDGEMVSGSTQEFVPGPYQAWANNPDSPFLTVDRPYQVIIEQTNGWTVLHSSANEFVVYWETSLQFTASDYLYIRHTGSAEPWSSNGFELPGASFTVTLSMFKEANQPVKDQTATIFFNKTT